MFFQNHSTFQLKSNIALNQLSNTPVSTGTPTAHRNTLVRDQAETIISQPTVGRAQTRYTGRIAAILKGAR